MICPKCDTNNQDTFQFCMKCGNPLAESTQNMPIAPNPVNPPSYPPPSQPIQAPQYQPRQPQSNSHLNYGYPINYEQPDGTGQQYYPDSYGASTINIWGPFAGFGTRRRHVGWLMDGRSDRAAELSKRVGEKFRERQVPAARIQHEILVGKGVLVEKRPYFVIRNGLVSLALNISKFGKDLFVSIASYLKPPVSQFRVIVLAVMAIFWMFSTFALPTMVQNISQSLMSQFSLFGEGGNNGNPYSSLVFLLCVLGPLALLNNLALVIFIIYSLYKWLTEKDILAGLRSAPNEFNEDDLMAMEKSIEQTVRIVLDEIGLDSNDLKPVLSTGERRII